MPRALKISALIACVVFIASSWALMRLAQVRAQADAHERGPAGVGDSGLLDMPASDEPALFVPEFSLTDQSGKPFTRDDLKGRITIVGFVFTNCPFVCPTLTEKMHGLSIALKNEPVRFLSISVDPEHDTPEALAAFAKLHDADTSRWTFLTGDKAQINAILTDGLKFASTPDPANPITLPDGSKMDNIVHPSWFVLLGPDAEVLSLYRPSDEMNMQVLLDDVRRLAKDLPKP